MNKLCNTCKEEKPLIKFSNNKFEKDGKQRKCKSCKNKYNRNHYKNNQKKYLSSTLKSKKKIRNTINALKNKPCIDCKIWYPHYVMDFDHVRGIKIEKVSRLLSSASMTAIKKEIEKCELVCANCHRVRTHKRKQKLLGQDKTTS